MNGFGAAHETQASPEPSVHLEPSGQSGERVSLWFPEADYVAQWTALRGGQACATWWRSAYPVVASMEY